MTTVGLARKLSVSRQAIHRQFQTLLRQGKIRQFGTSKRTTYYVLNDEKTIRTLAADQIQLKKRYQTNGLEEDRVYEELKLVPYLLTELSDNARSIFQYAFTEMLNNAIDHSKSPVVEVAVRKIPQVILFTVADHGVGIFENICTKKGLKNEMEGLQDLLKGKQTTAPERHSGEGIFFTSKIADRLTIQSHRKELIVDNRLGDIFIKDRRFVKGTHVIFELNTRAARKIADIFRNFTNEDYQFQKSQVSVKLYQEEEEYVSRSQAKRLLHALGDFEEITLDFQGVRTIGQGFADEIFRVFALRHPEIKIIPLNCHENVLFMIERAKSKEENHGE